MIYQTFVPAATVLLQYEGSLTEMKRQKEKKEIEDWIEKGQMWQRQKNGEQKTEMDRRKGKTE